MNMLFQTSVFERNIEKACFEKMNIQIYPLIKTGVVPIYITVKQILGTFEEGFNFLKTILM